MDKNAPVIPLSLTPREAATLLRALPHIPISGEKAMLRQALDDLDSIEVKLRVALDTHVQAELKAAKKNEKPGPILPDAPEEIIRSQMGKKFSGLDQGVKTSAVAKAAQVTRRRHGKK